MWACMLVPSSYFVCHTDCVEKRYPKYNYRNLMATLSQKCRDAGRMAMAEVKVELVESEESDTS